MGKTPFLSITIWDNNAARMAEIDHNIHLVLRELKLKGIVNSISEPPLLARENLLNRVPVLEIEEKYWSLKANTVIGQTEIKNLLIKIVSFDSSRDVKEVIKA